MIAAGIVLFNPEIKRLTANLEALLLQVDKVYIYNNGCDSSIINYLNEKMKKTHILGDGENRGIAKALNCIMQKADEEGYKWVITMDQDTVIVNDMVKAFSERMKSDNIGIICPHAIDKRRIYMKQENSNEDEYVNDCITSGSCTKIEAWKAIGGFDEWLFIDLVDNDFCKRLILSNYKILKVWSIVIDQEFGDIQLKSFRIVTILVKVAKLAASKNLQILILKLSYKKKISPKRIYYSVRNVIYLNKKFVNYSGIGYTNYNCKSFFGFILCFMIPSFMRAENKKEVYKAIIKGIRDGKNKVIEPWVS